MAVGIAEEDLPGAVGTHFARTKIGFHAGEVFLPFVEIVHAQGEMIAAITRKDRVAAIAYTTGRDLKKEWRVVWPPGLQNFLVNTGQRKGGLCFQFAERLLWRLSALNWNTLEFHWAESFERTSSEHNVIVVTAKGQNFYQGIILDNWRYGGRLVWGLITEDPHYQWHENQPQFAKVLNRRVPPDPAPKVPASSSPAATSVQER